MGTRKTEWLASIKPILDKEEVKNDARVLAKELSDILEFKVTDADSLEQLTKEFNKQLTNMGKQQIIFSEKTLQGIVSQFANAVAEGFAKGADVGIQESLQSLKAEKAKFVAQQKQLRAQKKKFEEISDWTYDIKEMSDNEFHFFNSDEIDAMKKEAKKIGMSFDDYVLKIKQEVEELQWSLSKMQKGEMSWDSDVIAKFYERSHDMFRISKTLSKNPDLVQDKEILGDYDFANLKYMFAEDLYGYADRFDAVTARIDKSLNTVKTKIAEIDTKLKTVNENSGAIVDNRGLKDGLKTLQEIEEAYDRILTKDKNRPQRPDQKKVQSIQKALEWQPTGTKKDDGINVVAQQYQNAKDTGDWVQEYKALLKYIRLYESYLNSENKTHRNKVTKPSNDFTKLYDQLKPMYENAQNALRDLVNKATNQSLVGVDSADTEKVYKTSSDNIQVILKDIDKFLSSNKDKKIEDYFKLIASGAYEMSNDVKSAIEATIGSIGTLSSIDIGANNLGGLIGEKSALILRKPHFDRDKQKWSTDESNDNAIELKNRLRDANISDANLGKIQEVINAEEYLVELQNRVSGAPISTIGETIEDINPDVLNATETSIQSLIKAMRELYNIGVEVDVENLGNILYDGKSDQFGIVDMDVKHSFESFEEMLNAFAQAVRNQVEDIANILNNPDMAQAWSRFADRIDNEVEKAKAILPTVDGFNTHKENIKAIQDETKAQDELKNIQNQNIDDDSETIIKENGLLEDKLELLRDIADQYASNITQKQRNRYEELNQKDMDSGLTNKEEDLYYELGEQIDAADSALEEFGQTYDKIILKLENGKNVEILPDDKGLRSLYKFADEYGETYNGIEIKDVIFERIKQETSAHQENTEAIKNETKAQQQAEVQVQANDTEIESNKEKIKSYEELVAVVKEYFNLASQLKEEFNESEIRQDAFIISDRYENIDTDEGKREQMMKDYNALWSEREKVTKSFKTSETYISSDGNEYLGSERDIERLTEEINALSASYIYLGGSVDDFSSKAKKISAATSWDLFKKAEEQDLANDKVAEEFNNPIKEKMNAIEASLVKQQLNPDSLAVWSALEINSGKFEDRLNAIARALGIEIPQAAQQAQQSVGGLNNELQTAGNNADNIDDKIGNGSIFGTGTGDASLADVDAAKEEAEKQRLEKERIEAENLSLQQEIANKNDELGRVRDELTDEIYRNSEARGELYTQISDAELERDKAQEYQRRAEAESREKDSIIQGLREQLTKVQSGEGGTKTSIDVEKLKNTLSAITYNVKVVQDTDNTDNKVAIDKASLEETLKSVFANILNPQTQQNDGENNQSPWALESTLQTVKGVLDNIQTNTAKIGTVKASNVDTIAGTALDSRLVEIKSVLESIDTKIAKGGVIATRGSVKQAGANAQATQVNAQVARSNMMKSIINDYETLGKLSAQFANDGNLETKAKLENLKEEIKRKRASLKVTMEENAKLREQYSIAFDAQKRLLDAADKEKSWKKRVKDAQRASGINAATSAANAGDQSVLRAIGTDGISADFEKKAKKLSDQIKILRGMRDDVIKLGEQASDKDRDDLSKQISQVKTLKTEVDGYLKIHEKYSGDNVTDLGDGSTFGAAGTDEYWNNITKAIKAQATGRVIIKGLNADTGELTGTTKIAANTFAQWSATVDPITGRLSMLRTGIKKTETFIEAINRKTREIFTYFSGSSIIFKIFNELKQGVQYVKEIDLAMTELKKVTDETEETYDKFLKTAAKTANKVGSTIKDIVSSTADWARLGYTIKEAAQLAESTQILMNVSEFTDVSQATDTLISAVQAFGYTAETSMEVVDLLNVIGNNYAISTADLAQSLTKSSASLVAAGGDLAEAAALTATANAIIQDADSVGTALKTTSLRLRATDTKLLDEEGLDSEGAVTSKSKLQSKVKALSGVDILTATGEYKSTYEILSQIADVWEDISDIDQAALLELISGGRRLPVHI